MATSLRMRKMTKIESDRKTAHNTVLYSKEGEEMTDEEMNRLLDEQEEEEQVEPEGFDFHSTMSEYGHYFEKLSNERIHAPQVRPQDVDDRMDLRRVSILSLKIEKFAGELMDLREYSVKEYTAAIAMSLHGPMELNRINDGNVSDEERDSAAKDWCESVAVGKRIARVFAERAAGRGAARNPVADMLRKLGAIP